MLRPKKHEEIELKLGMPFEDLMKYSLQKRTTSFKSDVFMNFYEKNGVQKHQQQ